MKNEFVRTGIYVGSALLLAVIAWAIYPRAPKITQHQEINKPLFAEFEPTQARSLDIVKYENAKHRFDDFSVEQTPRGWVIPSHNNYPADATEQMKDAATSLLGLTVLDVKTDNEEDHEEYGVIEPDQDTVNVGQEGVGVLVTIKDKAKQTLASMIVGNTVKDNPARRYVRKPGQRRVYEIEYDLGVLKTDFRDWIERDLLNLESFDIEQLTTKKYQVDPTRVLQGVADVTHDYQAKVKLDKTDWILEELIEYKNNKPENRTLTPDQELNTTRLNDLRNELDELEIVDVKRKPEGFGSKQDDDGKQLSNTDAISLIGHGFVPVKSGLIATNGELLAGLKDGVVYHLYFGNIAPNEEGSDINHHMMVTTLIDRDLFPMPVKERLPSIDDFKPKNGDGAPAPPGDNDAAPKPPGSDPDDEKEEEAAKSDVSEDGKKEDSQDDEASGSSDGEPTAEETAVGEPTAGTQNDDKVVDEEKKDDVAQSDDSDKETPEEKLEKERQRIEKDYQRKLDDREERIQEAEIRSRELNARFADWYYVISEDAFSKLNLDKSKLIKKKGEPDIEEDPNAGPPSLGPSSLGPTTIPGINP